MIDFISGAMPKNYHLTYSVHEKTDLNILDWILGNGGSAAIIIGKKFQIPERFFPEPFRPKYPVFNADLSDARFLDPRGSIGYLKAKGPARKSSSRAIFN